MTSAGQMLGWIARCQAAEVEIARLRGVVERQAALMARLELLPVACGVAAERRMLGVAHRLLGEVRP